MNAVTTTTANAKRDKILAVIDDPTRFSSLLPPDMDVSRFTAVLKRGLQQNPAILNTDPGALILACQSAAQDGLLPDGREGALVIYGGKVQWLPMIAGLRKRLAAVGYDIRADVVYENDTFDYDLGDDPRITHKAPPLGQDRGKVIGAYAIATDREGNKYREVMDITQLDAVAKVSRSGSGGPWSGPFRTEMQRKTVAKRLIKSLPMHDDRLNDLITRDNADYDLERPSRPQPSETARRVDSAVRGVPTEPVQAPAGEVIDDAEFEEAPAGEVVAGDDTPTAVGDF